MRKGTSKGDLHPNDQAWLRVLNPAAMDVSAEYAPPDTGPCTPPRAIASATLSNQNRTHKQQRKEERRGKPARALTSAFTPTPIVPHVNPVRKKAGTDQATRVNVRRREASWQDTRSGLLKNAWKNMDYNEIGVSRAGIYAYVLTL